MISEEFFKVNSNHLYDAIIKICEIFKLWHQEIPSNNEVDNYEEYIDAYAAFESYLLANSIKFDSIVFLLDRKENIRLISEFFTTQEEKYIELNNEKITKETIDFARDKYKQKFKIGFGYEFSDGDLKRIQTLINELRDYITTSTDFDAEHRDRILNRLENLQKELHKRVSSLDRFWGLVGEAGVVLGKFGKDAKPFVDRIRELTQIVWNTQARTEELPSGTKIPLLEKNIDNEK